MDSIHKIEMDKSAKEDAIWNQLVDFVLQLFLEQSPSALV